MKLIQNILILFLILLNTNFSFVVAEEKKEVSSYSPPNFSNQGLMKVYKNLKTKCDETHLKAQKMCLQQYSPALRGATETISPMVSLLAGLGSMADVCSGFAKVSRIAQAGIATYQAECGYFQSKCDTDCSKLLILKDDFVRAFGLQCSAVSTDKKPTLQFDNANISYNDVESCVSDFEQLTQDIVGSKKAIGSTGYAIETCEEYSRNIVIAGMNLLALVASKQQAKDCKDESSSSGLDCTKSENKQMAECICLSNPRSPGCSASSLLGDMNQGKLQNSAFNGISGTEDAPLPSGPTMGGPGMDGSVGGGPGSGVNAPGAGSPPGVPGGGGMGGSSGGSAGSGSGSRYKVMPIGEEGGGGGGGGGYRSGSSRSSSDSDSLYNSKYASYLPGGAKDPLKNPASVDANLKSEITGVGGKSNWDKVRERYNDNRYKMLRD